MSDNKTPISIVLGIIEARKKQLEDRNAFGIEISGYDFAIQTLKFHLALEEEAIKEVYSDGRKSVLNSNPEIAFGTPEKYFNQTFKPE